MGVHLIPYVPVLGALIVLTFSVITHDAFVVAMATLLLIVVTVRQVMIVYENVSLTRDLEAKVAARTAQLTTLGSIVTSSSDAIIGLPWTASSPPGTRPPSICTATARST